MGTGFITTAVVLVAGYVIVSRIIGWAFRLVVPLVLVAVLASAGVFSHFMDERDREFPSMSYDRDPARSHRDDGGGIGDLRLRDVSDLAVDAVRSVLAGGLSLLDRLSPSGDEPHMGRDRPRDDWRPRAYGPPRNPDDDPMPQRDDFRTP